MKGFVLGSIHGTRDRQIGKHPVYHEERYINREDRQDLLSKALAGLAELTAVKFLLFESRGCR
jgi:hypothetical protein